MKHGDESFASLAVGPMSDETIRAALRPHGLTLKPDEARRVAELLGRDPTLTELTLFDTMWSEHCSYKSSRPTLKEFLPTEADNVVVGPVEDAGIVDFGEIDGVRYGIILAHESHNHPSQVMPVEGAATGIGGIVRDVYCMGGEVIASLDPLRFGWPLPADPTDGAARAAAAHRLEIAREVVTGIWEYGNALGVPNLGGDVYFHESFDENCLVNVVAVGIVPVDHITHSAVPPEAADEPYDLVLVGKPTDWSGMGGAAFASADLDAEAAKENKGSVQTPDPFLKRMLTVANRAVLEMARAEGVTIGFKDLGAGGVACVTSELADAGGFGCNVDLALVHVAEGSVPARVVACSETQERYGLAVPTRLTERVLEIYNDDFALPTVYDGACARRIGEVTTDRRYVLRYGERILCDAPLEKITCGVSYDREAAPPPAVVVDAEPVTEAAPGEIGAEWCELMGHPNLASREYLYRHYDPEVQGNTILRPGEADAGVVAPVSGSRRAVAMSADGNPLLGLADPWAAGARAVVEACRNVACVGGVPAAITDCLNFGNPERPEVFHQFREAVRGVGDACRGLGRIDAGGPLPVISGNVSFYNQNPAGKTVAPSPIIACVAVVEDWSHCRSQRFKEPGDVVFLLGEPSAHLGASLYRDAGFAAGRPDVPAIDFESVRAELAAVVDLVGSGLANAVHDLSDGGLAAALAEMAMGLEGQPSLGATLSLPADLDELTLREILFNEQGGFLLTVPADRADEAQTKLAASAVVWRRVGEVRAEPWLAVGRADIEERVSLSVAQVRQAWTSGLSDLMSEGEYVEPAAVTAERPTVAAEPAAAAIIGDHRPRVAVLQLPGVNCEDESAAAIAAAGGEATIFRWTLSPRQLADFDGYLIPGGFSYQDRVRAGAIAAKDPLLDVLRAAAEGGKPILGICNGCQVLVESGLVPGTKAGEVDVALAPNRIAGRRGYFSRWVTVAPAGACDAPFVEGLEADFPLPIAHAEGRFTHEDPAHFESLLAEGLVALQYYDDSLSGIAGGNPNGSAVMTAGLTNRRGNVLAMMPHPERAAWLYQVPEDLPDGWGRLRRDLAGNVEALRGAGPGGAILRRLIELC